MFFGSLRGLCLTIGLFTLVLFLFVMPSAPSIPSTRSPILADERVVLFETACVIDRSQPRLAVPIHGWIHEPVDSVVRREVLEMVLENLTGEKIASTDRARFERRIGLFLVDNERGKELLVRVAAQDFSVLPASLPNGHFEGTVLLHAGKADATSIDGFVGSIITAEDGRQFRGRVRLVDLTGISVISDIDDTVKVSEVADKKRLLARTFWKEFEAVPGMPALYQEWREKGVVFHYVSSSPWQLYEPLVEWMDRAGLPHDSLSLKRVRLKDSSILDLFAPGSETKPKAIEEVLAAFPTRTFVLVGDSGEEDPEVYAALLRSHPEQVVRVAIRNVTGASRDDARFRPLFAGLDPARWALFDDPQELEGWIEALEQRDH